MKPTKTLLIIVIIIVVLLLLAWIINSSSKKKTAAAANNQTPANPAITGRHIAVASNTTDYTAIINGKPQYLWAGAGNCQSGYSKITSGTDAGWCILTSSIDSKTGTTCITKDNLGNCIKWQDSSGNIYIKG